MWLYCPSCSKSVDIGNMSRYEVFSCTCGRKFRGIWAKVNEIYRWGIGWWIPKNKPSIWPENRGKTLCPFCASWISSRTSGYWPEVCKHCTRDLPTDNVNETTMTAPVLCNTTNYSYQSPPPMQPMPQQSTSGKQTRTGKCPCCSKHIAISFYLGQNNQRCPECRGHVNVDKW